MAIENPPLALQVATAKHSARLFREALSSLIGAAGGIGESGGYAVSEHVAANMSVNVAVGQAWVPGTSNAAQGQYFVRNGATVNLAINAASATNPRIDKIILRIKDEAEAGSGNEAILEALAGTAEAGSTLANRKGVAATPASSLVLAYVLVPALATSIVGGNIENVAGRVSTGVSTPRIMTEVTSYAPAGTTGFNFFSQSGSLFIKNAASNTNGGQRFVFLNAPLFASGQTLKIAATSLCNEVAPASGVCTIGLAAVSNGGGSAGTLLATLGSTPSGAEAVLPLNTSTVGRAESAAFTMPATGLYAMYAAFAGTVAANAVVGITAQLMLLS